jgi:integrase
VIVYFNEMQVLDTDRESKLYSNFTDACPAPKTRQNYIESLRAYMKFHKFEKYSELVDMPLPQIHDRLQLFIVTRRDQISTSYLDNLIAGIKKFYDSNDMEDDIKWNRLKKYKGEATEEHEDRAYITEEIQRLLDVSDLRLRCCILMEAQSGLRVGALDTILKSHLEEKEDCYKINVYKGLRGKGKYFTFIHPETRKAIDEYFAFRERCGEVIGPDSQLLRKDFNSEDSFDAKNNVQPLKKASIRRDMHIHLVKAGLRTVDHSNPYNRKEVKANHGFRKWYDTRLIKAGIHPNDIEIFIGHSKKGLKRRYNKPEEEELFEKFKIAIPFLSLDPTIELEKTIEKLSEEKNEVVIKELEHKRTVQMLLEENKLREREIGETDQKLDIIMNMIRQNPKLASVKPESLKKKLK